MAFADSIPRWNPNVRKLPRRFLNDKGMAGLGVVGGWGDALVSVPTATPDLEALRLNGQVSRRAHELRTAGDVQRAQDQIRFLDSITPAETAAIHTAPTDPREAQLQDILNQDLIAREAGSQRSMAGILQNQENVLKYLPVRRFNQDVAQTQFQDALATKRFEQEVKDKGLDRALREAQLGSTTDYHNARLDQTDTSQASREQNQQATLALRQQQATQTNQRAQSQQVRSRFQDALAAARRGAATQYLDQAFTSMFPELTPDQQAIAMGTLQERAMQGTAAGIAANQVNQSLGQILAKNLQDGQDARTARENAIALVTREMNRDQNYRGRLIYDPTLNRFVPTPSAGQAPAPMLSNPPAYRSNGAAALAPPSEGGYPENGADPSSFANALGPQYAINPNLPPPLPTGPTAVQSRPQYVAGPDGYLYQIINGQPVRTNLRRR